MAKTMKWRNIKGFESHYEINKLGQIRNKSSLKIKAQVFDKGTGYYKMQLWKDNNYYSFFVHRLIAYAFIDNPNNERCVNHLNGDRSDNRLKNLEWCSYSENHLHSYRELGRKYNKRKLSKENAIEIKNRIRINKDSVKEIADCFGVSKELISAIKRGTRWASIN